MKYRVTIELIDEGETTHRAVATANTEDVDDGNLNVAFASALGDAVRMMSPVLSHETWGVASVLRELTESHEPLAGEEKAYGRMRAGLKEWVEYWESRWEKSDT